MKVWLTKKSINYYDGKNVRRGLRFRFDSDVDSEVRTSIIKFSKWLRQNFCFPIRVVVYVKSAEQIKANDGDMVCGTCLVPDNRLIEPYIRIAVGDYQLLCTKYGRNDALATLLHSLCHELTHYFQWVDNTVQTEKQAERQAEYYASLMVDKYAMTTDVP